jgi:hypothetical protein
LDSYANESNTTAGMAVVFEKMFHVCGDFFLEYKVTRDLPQEIFLFDFLQVTNELLELNQSTMNLWWTKWNWRPCHGSGG